MTKTEGMRAQHLTGAELALFGAMSPTAQAAIATEVDKKLAHFNSIFHPEIREGNGLEHVVDRERHRVLVEAIRIRQRSNPLPIEPFVENADGNHPGMVYIPPGTSTLGTDDAFFSREEPERSASVSGFWIDVATVTNRDFNGVCPKHTPDSRAPADDDPVVNVTWFDAHRYACAKGKRLPTQHEWERAARGPYGWLYSFGPAFDADRVHVWPAAGPSRPVVHEPSPWGLLQMSGNVWEWMSEVERLVWSTGSVYLVGVVRGGSWRHCRAGARATISMALDLAQRADNVGFRCVSSM